MRWVVIAELLVVLGCAVAFAAIHGRRRPPDSPEERATWRQLLAMAVVVAMEAAALLLVGLGLWSPVMWPVLAAVYLAADVVMVRWLVLLVRARKVRSG
jgi:hypothetical protein